MKNKNSDKHFVSVIIPTLGRETINQTKKALRNQTRKPGEVIIILDKEKKGVGWARNQGIKKAKGDLIAITDDDCVPPRNWIETLVKTIDKYGADAVGGNYEETDSLLRAKRTRKNKYPNTYEIDAIGIVANGGNIMYKKSWLMNLLKKEKYIFNESMITGEDVELSWRLRRNGAKFVYVQIYVKHLRQITFFNYLRWQFIRGIGIASLSRAYSQAKGEKIQMQKSLLWSEKNKIVAFLKIIWLKVLGPFDIRNFDSFGDYATFWLGEKTQGLGYIYGMLNKSAGKGKWA